MLYCPSNIDPVWGITWPPTVSGEAVFLPCPGGFYGKVVVGSLCIDELTALNSSFPIGKISRFCTFFSKWHPPYVKDCVGSGFDGFKDEV